MAGPASPSATPPTRFDSHSKVSGDAHGAGDGIADQTSSTAGYSAKVPKIGSVSAESGTLSTESLTFENGVATYIVANESSESLKVGAPIEQGSVSAGHAEGARSSYQVSMPEADARSGGLARVNPYDPSSMPTGNRITLDSSQYASSDFSASFRHIATQNRIRDEREVGVVIEKVADDKVRVVTGPREAVDAYGGIGVELGKAKAMLGRSDKLGESTVQTAEFDLTTRAGKAAYDNFLATGSLPTRNDQGISGVSTTARLDASSQSQLDLSCGSHALTINGLKNTGGSVATTHADGSKDITTSLQYGDNVPLSITQKIDPAGHEIMADRRYNFALTADATTAALLNDTMGNDPNKAAKNPVVAGQTINLSFTEEQMHQLVSQAQAAAKANSQLTHVPALLNQEGDRADNSNSPMHFAVALAGQRGNNSAGLATCLNEISMRVDPKRPDGMSFEALPGSITDATNGAVVYTPAETEPPAGSAKKSATDYVDSLLAAYKANDNAAIRSGTQALASAPAGRELRNEAAATVTQQEQHAAQQQTQQQPAIEQPQEPKPHGMGR